jgi:hypothetical protein
MQNEVLSKWPAAKPGQAHTIGPKEDVQMINRSPATKEVRTLTVSTAVGSLTTYTWSLLNVLQSVTTASSDKAVIAALIRDRMLNDPLTGGFFDSIVPDSTKVTLTYKKAGVPFALTESDSNLATALVTAAAAADVVPFGSVLVRDMTDKTRFDLARLASTAGLGASVYDLTPVHVNDATYFVSVQFADVWYTTYITADGSATVDEIVDALVVALNAIFPAHTVLAAADDATATKLILTSEIPGMPIQEVKAWTDDATATWTVARADTLGKYADIDKAIVGIALEDQRVPGDVGTTRLEYPGGSAMTVRRQGVAAVLVEDVEVESDDEVWVGVTATHYGKVRTTKSNGDYAKCNALQWRGRAGTYGGTPLAWLEVVRAA